MLAALEAPADVVQHGRAGEVDVDSLEVELTVRDSSLGRLGSLAACASLPELD